MTISERIFEILQKKKMTQKEFSNRTGIPQSTVSDWKSKKINPASDKILIISDVLDVSPYFLLSGMGDEKYERPQKMVIEDEMEYYLIEKYRKLDRTYRERMLGYMEAVCDILYKQDNSGAE